MLKFHTMLSVRLPKVLKKKFDVLATKLGKTRQYIIIQLIERFIKDLGL